MSISLLGTVCQNFDRKTSRKWKKCQKERERDEQLHSFHTFEGKKTFSFIILIAKWHSKRVAKQAEKINK